MSQSTSEKICVLCGEDCSTKPRIKDSHGNYYCKTCHQDAEQRIAKRKRPVEIETAPDLKDAPLIDDLSISLDGDHDDSFGDDIGLAPDDSGAEEEKSLDSNDGVKGMRLTLDEEEKSQAEHPPIDERDDLNKMLLEDDESKAPEPEEDDPYTIMEDSKSEPKPVEKADNAPPDALDLLEEMADRQQSENLEASSGLGIEPPEEQAAPSAMLAPPRVASTSDSRSAFWPYVIGSLALIFGGLLGTVATMGLVGNITRRMDRSFFEESMLDHFLIMLVVPGLFAVLGGWEALAGFCLLLKKTFGANSLRYWARINVICAITLFLFAGGMMMFASSNAPDSMSAGQKAGIFAGTMIGIGFVTVLALIWPIILLIWFRREKVQDDIESWE